jgi:ABC-2 type transport system permease protein
VVNSTVRLPPAGWARITRAAGTFGDLFYIQFAAIRTGWQWFFLVSSVIPLGLLFFLKFAAPTTQTSTMLYYITGNAVVALMFNALGMLSGQLSSARQNKTFDFYAGLPVSRTVLILAAVAVAVLFAIPGMILLLVLGILIFHVTVAPSILVLPVLVLSPPALAGLGALIGVLAPNQQVSAVITNLALVAVMFLSPVLVPASALPSVLQLTARLLPPTYAADALRQTIAGHVNAGVGLDLAFLLAFTVGSLYLVTGKLDWRLR